MAFVADRDAANHPLLLYLTGEETSRPPNWRWEAAKWLAKNPRYVRRFTLDNWTIAALKFQRSLLAVHNAFDQALLGRQFPGIYEAQKCYLSPDKSKRWIIEAYLCAGASLAEIGRIVNMRVETVGFFAYLYYDVIGKTEHWGYIFTEALGKPFNTRLSENDMDVLWKIYGLLKGPHLLGMLIKHDTSPGRAGSVSAAAAALQDLINGAVQVKTLIAARTMNPAIQPIELINAQSKLREVDIEAQTLSVRAALLEFTEGDNSSKSLSLALSALPFLMTVP
jgi:hypothetical protein